MRRILLTVSAATAATTLLVACGDDDPSNTAGSDPATSMPMSDDSSEGHDDHADASPVVEGAREVEVAATSFRFDPEEIEADVGEDVTIVLTSDDILHDLTIDDLDVHVAADAGETTEGGVRADETGTYTFYCSVPGHREAGMEGVLIIE